MHFAHIVLGEVVDIVGHLEFLRGSEHQVNSIDIGDFFRFELSVAAYHHNKGLLILTQGTPHDVAATLIGIVRYGARVDYVYVSLFLKLHPIVTLLFEVTRDGRGLAEIELTAQCIKCYFWRMRHGPAKILLFVLFFSMFTGCGPSKRDRPGMVFRYNESANITTLDPAFSRNQALIWATHQLFNGLVQLDSNLRPQPSIAKSWSIDSTRTVYDFCLRQDVYFHAHEVFGEDADDPATEQGRRVVAEDFVYSFDRLRSPGLAAPGAWVLDNVRGYEALNDTLLRITLNEPFPPFLGLLSMKYCSVVPREIVEHPEHDRRDDPVGTGPFYFKLWAQNEKLVFRRNPFYFETDDTGRALPYLEAVAITFVPDKQAAFLELVKGNLDFLSGLDASYKDELLTREGELQGKYMDRFKLTTLPYLNTEYLGIVVDSNQRIEPLKERALRQALNYGIDRAEMMRYLRNNIGEPATAGFVPPGLPSFNAEVVKGYHYDEERAKGLLRAVGPDLPEITLQTNASYLDLCEYMQAQWNALGIPVQVEVLPPSTLRQMMATSKTPFFRGSWVADYADAENYLSLFYSENAAPNGPNYTHFRNEQFDAWYEEARAETNDSLRYRLYQRMDSLVLYEAPVVPLFYDEVLRFTRKEVSGLTPNALNLLDLRRVWIKPR